MSKKIIFSIFLFFNLSHLIAQNVGINASGANPNASAMLDVNSVNKGVLVPNISLTGKTSPGPIASPATSLFIYNITTAGSGANQVTPGYHYWDGSQWVRLFDDLVNASDHDWYAVGGTNSPNNISDDIFTNGKVGIGAVTPNAMLTLNGIASNLSGPHFEVYNTTDANNPIFQNLNWNSDNVSLNFGSHYDGAWKSSDVGSNFQIYKFSDVLRIRFDSGIPTGSPLTWNSGISLLTNGNVGIGIDNPSNKMHVAGDIRMGEIFPANTGTLPDYGNRLFFSGSPAGTIHNSDNSDPLWMSRYNIASDQSEIRVNLGDNIQAEDKFHIGTTTGGNFVTHAAVTGEGRLGIQTDVPRAYLDVSNTSFNQLKSVLARLPEGGTTGNGTYLGVTSGVTQPINVTSFSIQHRFYDILNGSIDFERGSSSNDGSITFNTLNNTERMRIQSGGNIGMGIANPEELLVINGITRFIGKNTTDDPNLRIHTEYGTGPIANLSAITGGSDRRYRILTEANYISTNRDWWIFDALDGNNAASDGGIEFRTTGSTGIQIPLMTIEGSGQVGIGTNVPAFQLQLSTNSAAKPTSSVWTVASDKRLKTDVIQFTDGMNIIDQINPVWFTYNGQAGMPLETGVGTIAQELQKIAPYMVKPWEYFDIEKQDSTEYLGVDYGAMDFILINAAKEQQIEIDNLKQEVLELKQIILNLSNED